MIIANSTGYELAPAGTHNVVCVDVIDCGEAYGIEPDPVTGMRLVPGATEDRKPQAKVRFVFESEKKMADGRPFQIDRMFGATLSDQGHLKPFLDAWGIELEMTRTQTSLWLVASCLRWHLAPTSFRLPDQAQCRRLHRSL